MSETESSVITYDDYRNYRAKQDKDLRKEFMTLHTKIDEGTETLQVELSQVKANLGDVEGRLGDFGVRLERMERVRMNATKSRPWEKIETIGKFVPGKGYEEPLYFPRNAGEFWRLKRNPTRKNIYYLISLVKFYDIDDYQHWDKTNSEQYAESDMSDVELDDADSDSALSALSLEDAVQQYPSRAVEKVAAVLGLVEENFAEFYEGALKYQQQPRVIEKRPQVQRDEIGKDAKRPKPQFRGSPVAPKPTLTLSQLFPEPKSDSPKSNETRLEYGDTSTVIRARLKKLQNQQSRSPSVSHPDGSPTVPNESPTFDEANNRSPSGMQAKQSSQGPQTAGIRARD
ncbi:hypothetical protein B0O99DRAFT_603152 [Bisporella sp. PMI_857]|nr:hypothetical protein B0O99DRAFT_603152 [Bisporella sp. PMI_857]